MKKTTCRYCKQPVLLADTINRAPVMLNPAPTPAGTIILSHGTALVHNSVGSIHPARLNEPRYKQHACKEQGDG